SARNAAPPTLRIALDALRQAHTRAGLAILELPAPSTHAPYALAMAALVADDDGEAHSVGRFILLYDNRHSDVWDGDFRIVTYIRTSVETDLGEDPLLTDVAWTWILESL